MTDNKISKALKILGSIMIAIGIISFIILVVVDVKLMTAGIAGMISGVISGIVFLGFSEVISLLQQNVDTQKKILSEIKKQPETILNTNRFLISKEKEQPRKKDASGSASRHLFRCESCKNMIEERPCPFCGK